MIDTKYLVVGCGFYGAVVAQQIAEKLREKVIVIDRYSHPGGNSHSRIDPATHIECHTYGSHIFHTANAVVWNYINRFGNFNNYRHKVLIQHRAGHFFLPINLKTINDFYKMDLSPSEAEALIRQEAAQADIRHPANLEEAAISMIGRKLYDAFFREYTQKQWGCAPSQLPASIFKRLPIRYHYNIDYFDDPYQGVPRDGYGKLFESLLADSRIQVLLDTPYQAVQKLLSPDCHVIYTGMLDELLDYKYGPLAWRSLKFDWETLPIADYQGTAVVNYADHRTPYSRTHEFKHYHPEQRNVFEAKQTILCHETPQPYQPGRAAFYPVDDEENRALHQRYRADLDSIPNFHIGGRLGAYRYWNMDQTIENALHFFDTKLRN